MTPRQLIEPARLAGNALLHTQSDARLVDLVRAGNERAFEVIVGRYRSSLLRYCERLLPPGRAEDAVQQAFLNAYRAIGRNEAELNLKPWLYRVAHNASLNLLRQNGWNYDEIPENFDGVIQPPQALEQSERVREVIRAVQDLPDRQRDAIILRELEGRSYEEIGATLGVTDGAVRQLLNRARGTLRGAATALTPPRLLESLFDKASSPSTAQIAEMSAGAGGAAGVVKLGAALVVAGALGGAVVAGPAHHLVLGGSGGPDRGSEALAVTGGGAGEGAGGYNSLGGATALGIGTGPVQGHGEGAPGGTGTAGPAGTTSATGPGAQSGSSGGGTSSRTGSGGGSGGGFVDFNPNSGGGGGSGGGDHGGGGGDGGHSGSGSVDGTSGGGDHSGGDGGHSGSGSTGSDGGSSGSGSGGSDGGRSGSPDGGSSGSGSVLPTIGTSGPGGGTSGSSDGGTSGSSDGGTSGSGTDISGSGSSDGGGGIDHSGPGG